MLMLLKSSFSINSYDGCDIGCKYCILSTLENRSHSTKIEDEIALVEKLKNYKFYNKEIPITINNITDPFLNNNVFESTIKILKLLNENKFENPYVLITKAYLSKKQLEILQSLNFKIIIMYTFSGLSTILENRDEQKQIDTLKGLSELTNVELLHYYRPVIEGINSDENSIKKVVDIVINYCKASIVAGIRINSHLKKVFDNLQIEIPFKFDTEHKVITNETYNKILDTFKKHNPDYPIFKKTSCGLAFICKMADYNGHSGRINYCSPECASYHICFAKGSIGFCSEDCKNYELCKSSSENVVTTEDINKLLKIIGKNAEFEIGKYVITIKGEFTQEEVTFMRHKLRRNIKVEKLIRCNNEDKLSK